MSKLISNLLWCIDIGNSSISICASMGRKWGRIYEFSDSNIPKISKLITNSGGKYKNTAIICSVVPKIESQLKFHLKDYKSIKCISVGKQVRIHIKSSYRNYNQLGNDRKVNVLAALRHSRPPFLILDFGTATTVDYVSRQGVFEGGMILPGLKSCLDLLHEKTALLPPVKIRPVHYFLGRSTREGMLSGVLHGYGAMVNGLIRSFRARYGQNLKTIGTGGLVDIVGKYCGGFNSIDRLLTLRGIRAAYEEHMKYSRIKK